MVVRLSQQDRARLERWNTIPDLPERQKCRVQVLLWADDGANDTDIAARLNICRQTCMRIRKRFLASDPFTAVRRSSYSARTPQIQAQTIVTLTKTTSPGFGMVWTRARMAKKAGISASAVGRIWKQHDIKPHLVARPKLSDEPRFSEKVEAVVGLYLAPPIRALVLRVNKNRRVEPLCRALAEESLRISSIPAALGNLDGKLQSTIQRPPGHQAFLRFLQEIHRNTPAESGLYLTMDNHATPPHPKVGAWLGKNWGVSVRFALVSDGWQNMVARFFQGLPQRPLRQGMIESMVQLEKAISAYLQAPHASTKPFIWTGKAPDRRAKPALDNLQT